MCWQSVRGTTACYPYYTADPPVLSMDRAGFFYFLGILPAKNVEFLSLTDLQTPAEKRRIFRLDMEVNATPLLGTPFEERGSRRSGIPPETFFLPSPVGSSRHLWVAAALLRVLRVPTSRASGCIFGSSCVGSKNLHRQVCPLTLVPLPYLPEKSPSWAPPGFWLLFLPLERPGVQPLFP